MEEGARKRKRKGKPPLREARAAGCGPGSCGVGAHACVAASADRACHSCPWLVGVRIRARLVRVKRGQARSCLDLGTLGVTGYGVGRESHDDVALAPHNQSRLDASRREPRGGDGCCAPTSAPGLDASLEGKAARPPAATLAPRPSSSACAKCEPVCEGRRSGGGRGTRRSTWAIVRPTGEIEATAAAACGRPCAPLGADDLWGADPARCRQVGERAGARSALFGV